MWVGAGVRASVWKLEVDIGCHSWSLYREAELINSAAVSSQPVWKIYLCCNLSSGITDGPSYLPSISWIILRWDLSSSPHTCTSIYPLLNCLHRFQCIYRRTIVPHMTLRWKMRVDQARERNNYRNLHYHVSLGVLNSSYVTTYNISLSFGLL